MADLALTYNTTAGAFTVNSVEFDQSRFNDWMWAQYAPTDADGNPLTRNAANLEVAWENLGAAVYQGLKANVLRWEREEAAKQARDSVTDIET